MPLIYLFKNITLLYKAQGFLTGKTPDKRLSMRSCKPTCESLQDKQDPRQERAAVQILVRKHNVVKEMLGQEEMVDLDILLVCGRVVEVLSPCHSAIFPGGLFSILLPSLTFVPRHCASAVVSLEISATLWKKQKHIWDPLLANLNLTSFTIFSDKSHPRFTIQQNKKLGKKRKEKKKIKIYLVLYYICKGFQENGTSRTITILEVGKKEVLRNPHP